MAARGWGVRGRLMMWMTWVWALFAACHNHDNDLPELGTFPRADAAIVDADIEIGAGGIAGQTMMMMTSTGGTMGTTGPRSCPTGVPAEGATCTAAQAGLECQYGADPRPECRVLVTCRSTTPLTWTLAPTDCPTLPTVVCPKTSPQGQACPETDAFCVYGGVPCACVACADAGAGKGCAGGMAWQCATPPDAPCPPGVPNAGTSCTPEGQRCVYACGPTGARQCTNGVWVRGAGGPCP